MSTTTITMPASFAGFGSAGVTQATIFDARKLELVMMSRVDTEAFGLATAYGDISGSGSDTLTSVAVDGVGANAEMSPLATETSQVVPSSYSLVIDSVTVGFYGYASELTFKGAVLSAPSRIMTFDDLIRLTPDLYNNTVANLFCDVGATISTAVGSATTDLSIDDIIDLIAAIDQTDGANDPLRGSPKLVLEPHQLTQLKASARTEPAFKEAMSTFLATQAVSPDISMNFLGLGMDMLRSSRVTQSGGAYQGFCVASGGFALVRANYGGVLRALSALGTMPISGIADNSRGLLLFMSPSQANSQIVSYTTMLAIGMAKLDTKRRFQRRVISKV